MPATVEGLRAAIRVISLCADKFDRGCPPVNDEDIRDLSEELRVGDLVVVASAVVDAVGQPAFKALMDLKNQVDRQDWHEW
jgi:hypothetical protein